MAKNNKTNPGIMLIASFFTLFAVNALVIFVINLFFPNAVVLGTLHISKTWALVLSMTAFTLIHTLLLPFINQYESDRGKKFSTMDWMGIYFVINFAGLWLVARAAHVLGFGISSFWIAIALAVILDFAQSMAMMQLEKSRTSSK